MAITRSSFRMIFSPLVALVCFSAAGTAQEVKWHHDYRAARAESRATQRPMLLDFGFDGCIWCKRLDSTTFRDPRVVRMLNEKFVRLKVDANLQPALVRALNVSTFPTLMIAGSSGKVLNVQEGYLSATQLLAQLQKHAQDSRKADQQLYQLASEAVAKGDYVCAIANLKTILSRGDNSAVDNQAKQLLSRLEARASKKLALAQRLTREGKLEEARKTYQELLQSYPGTQTAAETIVQLVSYVRIED